MPDHEGLPGVPKAVDCLYKGKFTPKLTRYNGVTFRSTLEARWAVFFNALGVPYVYEPKQYDLRFFDDLHRYTPDFWLPDQELFIEVKPAVEDKNGYIALPPKGVQIKMALLSWHEKKDVLAICGSPSDPWRERKYVAYLCCVPEVGEEENAKRVFAQHVGHSKWEGMLEWEVCPSCGAVGLAESLDPDVYSRDEDFDTLTLGVSVHLDLHGEDCRREGMTLGESVADGRWARIPDAAYVAQNHRFAWRRSVSKSSRRR